MLVTMVFHRSLYVVGLHVVTDVYSEQLALPSICSYFTKLYLGSDLSSISINAETLVHFSWAQVKLTYISITHLEPDALKMTSMVSLTIVYLYFREQNCTAINETKITEVQVSLNLEGTAKPNCFLSRVFGCRSSLRIVLPVCTIISTAQEISFHALRNSNLQYNLCHKSWALYDS